MRPSMRRSAGLAGLACLASLSLILAACGSSAGTPGATTPSVTPADATPANLPSAANPSLTPVPGATTVTPGPASPSFSTTETDWGTILDAVPAGFPVYPDAEPTEPDGPASGAWTVHADPATVSRFYESALAAAGYSNNDRSGPLEDGSYVVDTSSDLPECRIQTTVRPQGDQTMITVMFGAGCRGLGG